MGGVRADFSESEIAGVQTMVCVVCEGAAAELQKRLPHLSVWLLAAIPYRPYRLLIKNQGRRASQINMLTTLAAIRCTSIVWPSERKS